MTLQTDTHYPKRTNPMNSAYAVPLRPIAARAVARPAAAKRATRAPRRGIGFNVLLGALIAALVGFYFAAYVATVLAVGHMERADDRAGELASALHDAERALARGGALSYGDAAAAGLAEVAPRFVSSAGAVAALSANER